MILKNDYHKAIWWVNAAKRDSDRANEEALKKTVRKAIYKKRRQIVEPVFGIIKSVLGVRQFSLRGVSKQTENDLWYAW